MKYPVKYPVKESEMNIFRKMDGQGSVKPLAVL